jgi:hypothetical protein
MSVPLFDGYPDPPQPPPAEKLSADCRRTIERQAKIDAGIHPANGLKLLDNGETCGTCDHLYRRQLGGTYLKCDLGLMSRGPASDIRAWWPACPKWEAQR